MKSPIKLAFAAATLLGASFVTLQPASAMPVAPTTGAETSALVQNVWYRNWGYYNRPYYRQWGSYRRPYYWGYYHRPHYWGYYHRTYYRHWGYRHRPYYYRHW